MGDSEIEIVIPHTCDIGACLIQKRDHVPAFGDAAFEARIEGIAGEEGQDVRLTSKFQMVSIVVHHGLKAGDSSYGFSRPGFDVVDIIVMDQTEVRTASPGGRVCNGEASGFNGRHSAMREKQARRRDYKYLVLEVPSIRSRSAKPRRYVMLFAIDKI